MDPSLIKALLMATAYEGALAVCGNLETVSGNIPVNLDPLIKDQGMQQKGIAVYEEAKVQYAVLVQAFQDTTGIWPDPQLPASATPAAGRQPSAAPVTAALQTLTKNPSTNIATLAQQLLAAVQAAAQAAAPAATAAVAAAPSSTVPSLGGSVAAGS